MERENYLLAKLHKHSPSLAITKNCVPSSQIKAKVIFPSSSEGLFDLKELMFRPVFNNIDRVNDRIARCKFVDMLKKY